MKKMSYKKKGLVLLLVGAMMLSVVGCDDKNNDDNTSKSSESTNYNPGDAATTKVVKIGEETVYLDEMNLYCLNYAYSYGITPEMVESAYSDSMTYDEYFKQQVIGKLRETKIEYIVAKSQNIELTDEQLETVETAVTNMQASMDKEIFELLGITEDTIRRVYTEQMYVTALESSVEPEQAPENLDELQFNHIYYLTFPTVEVSATGAAKKDDDGNYISVSDEEKEEALANAEEAKKKLEDGSEPADVAAEYNISSYSDENRGAIGSYSDNINEAIAELKDGEISDVIETSLGYSIIKVITANDEEFAEYYRDYYASQTQDSALSAQKQEWFTTVAIDEENDLFGDVWTNYSFLPIAKEFDKLGVGQSK